MKCENIFCIYQENGFCNNENESNIDWRGFCKNMIPVRTSRYTLNAEKLITQCKMRDGNHYFDKEIGIVTMTDEAFELFNSKIKFD
ncbi:MAG: hypothetical protein IJA80_09200 [Clostridia bacterium]|nr:hypothetical protein [Clostridia bacterium]